MTAAGLDRRRFLQLAVGTIAAGAVGGCTSGRTSTPAAPAVPTGRAAPTPGSSGSPDWAGLRSRLAGSLVRPGEPAYAAASRIYSPRFDSVQPAAIAYCASATDVARTVAFVQEHDLPLATRAGGHSYGGWSTGPGLVLDVTRLATVTVSRSTGTATVGAGTRLIDAYAPLAAAGVGIPAGSCPSVGIAGLALGGGIGVLARAWGLTCDNVAAVEIVTADGRVRRCDPDHDGDLFWASRGGGGGSFGVVTSFTFRTRPAPEVSTFYLRWPLSAAAEVVAAWQPWVTAAEPALWSTCKLAGAPGSAGRVVVAGTWIGSPGALAGVLGRLTSQLGAVPTTRSSGRLSYLPAMLFEAGCADLGLAACHLPPNGGLERQRFAATSHVLSAPLNAAAITTAVSQAGAASAVPGLVAGGLSLDSLGGAVSALAPGATAFGHRDALFSLQYTAVWRRGPSDNCAAYVRRFRTAMTPQVGNAAYVNYPDTAIPDFGSAYWGANYPKLQAVKRQYDRHEVFRFPQSVRPASA
jgi:FAD/FMN-containing dehydrogenase